MWAIIDMCPYSFDFFDGLHWDMEFEVSEYYDDDDN